MLHNNFNFWLFGPSARWPTTHFVLYTAGSDLFAIDPDGTVRTTRKIKDVEESTTVVVEIIASDSWLNFPDTADDFATLTISVSIALFIRLAKYSALIHANAFI